MFTTKISFTHSMHIRVLSIMTCVMLHAADQQPINVTDDLSALRTCEVTATATFVAGTVTVNTTTLPPAFTDVSVCDTATITNLCGATLSAGSVDVQQDQYADYFGNYHDYDTMRASRSMFNSLLTSLTTITPFDGAPATSNFGAATALSADGSLIAIGAPRSNLGAVYIYRWENGVWSPVQKILAPRSGAPGQVIRFGASVSLSYDGSVLAVAELTTYNGVSPVPLAPSVWLYTYDASIDQWVLQQEIPSVDPGVQNSNVTPDVIVRLSASGKYLMISYRGMAMRAEIWLRNDECAAPGAAWEFQQSLAGPLPSAPCSNCLMYATGGWADISANGSTVVIENNDVFLTGAPVRSSLYTRTGNIWSLQQTIQVGPFGNGTPTPTVALSADGQYFVWTPNQEAGLQVYVRRGTQWVLESSGIDANLTNSSLGSVLVSADGSMIVFQNSISSSIPVVCRSPDNSWVKVGDIPVLTAVGTFIGNGMSLSADGAVCAQGRPASLFGVPNNLVYVARTTRSLIPADAAIGGTLCVVGTATTNAVSLTGNIQVNGTITTGTTVVACTVSDEQLKHDVVDVSPARVDQVIDSLQPVHFTWKEPQKYVNGDQQQAGFVAQDVAPLFPDWVDYDDVSPATLSLPHEMIGFMVAAIKNLQRIDAAQQARMAQ